MQDTYAHARLYRSRQDRMIAGVAGGLGQYFRIDPVLVRIAIVVLTLATGVGLLAYIILAIVVPERPGEEDEPIVPHTSVVRDNGRQLAGYALVAFGVLVFAGNLGLYRIFDLGRFWPILLVIAGAL